MRRRDFSFTRTLPGAAGSINLGTARWIVALLLVMTMLPALSIQSAGAQVRRGTQWEKCQPGVLMAGYSDRINETEFDGTRVGGLSALAYDDDLNVYYAIVDNETGTPARFYTLSISRPTRNGFMGPTVEAVTILHDSSGEPFDWSNFDGEGIAVTPQGTLLISSETGPSIYEFTREGQLIGELPIPGRFLVAPEGEGQANQTLEGLTISPGGHVVYAANESPLLVDGDDQVRFLRYGYQRFGRTTVAAEYYYQTEPGQSVGEVLALSDTELLVLERSFVPSIGNTIRIFLTSTAGATDVSRVASLDGAGIDPLPKQLLVDIGDCPPGDAEVDQSQPNPLLDNFEGLAFGPRFSSGHQVLYVLSDDNFNPSQVTRVIALAVDEDLLELPGSPFLFPR